MALDGRRIAQAEPARDAYESPGVRVVAVLIVVVPALAILALVYWTGTWMGGWMGGVLSVVSTAATVLLVWAFRRRRARS
jgi:protein-S-isoprenylcysteine O-methyltransferase Ste14